MAADNTNNAFWLGSITNDLYMTAKLQSQYPAITVIGKKMQDFQNSPYRGEWQQRLPINAGELRDALVEISRLIKHAENTNTVTATDAEPTEHEDD